MADDTGQPGPSGEEHNPWAPRTTGSRSARARRAAGARRGAAATLGRRAAHDRLGSGRRSASGPPAPGAPGGASASGQGSRPASAGRALRAQPPGGGHGSWPGLRRAVRRTAVRAARPGAAYGYPAQAPAFGYGAGPGGTAGRAAAAERQVRGGDGARDHRAWWSCRVAGEGFLGIITSPIALGLGLSDGAASPAVSGGRGQAGRRLRDGIIERCSRHHRHGHHPDVHGLRGRAAESDPGKAAAALPSTRGQCHARPGHHCG